MTLGAAILLCGAAVGALAMRFMPTGSLLLVMSEPAGAEILVDGKAVGDRTPAALRGIAAGEHTVTLRHSSFNDLVREVRLDASGRQVVEAHLAPRTRVVELATVPAGATVFVDGTIVAAKTPLSFELTEGEYHAVKVEKPGYETVTRKIGPDDTNELASIELVAETQPRGVFFVDASAPAAVWIDGQYSGFLTPTPGLIVAAGEHTVQLRDDRGQVLDEVRARVQKGETSRLALQVRRGGK